jgi:hypothetical protein
MTCVVRRWFSFHRVLATAILILMLMTSYEINIKLQGLGVQFSFRTFWWQVIVCLVFLAIAGLVFVWTGYFDSLIKKIHQYFNNHWLSNPAIRIGIFLLFSFGFSIWVLKIGYIALNGFWTYLFFFSIVSILGMICLRPITPERSLKIALIGSMLISAAIFKFLIYSFQGISTSPFSLSWSEGSRYYYASLFFSNRLYDVQIAPSTLHPSRYLMLALPFVFKDLPIWLHRTWQVFLWVIMPTMTGITLSKRLKIQNRTLVVFFSAWVYLFLNLGPVYYHLLVCVLLIYWGVDFNKPGQSFFFLILASVWAGLSRINWIPVPAFLVITLYFFERPWNRQEIIWRYIRRPLFWGLGIFVAFSAYALYIPLSGNQPGKFRSTFTSDLLWNRLWPNPTYSMGIFWGAILVSIPLCFVVIAIYRKRGKNFNPIMLLGITSMILILFIGGLVVSVKIGGGSNLHNLDAYFVLLMTVVSYMFWDPLSEGVDSVEHSNNVKLPSWILYLAVLIPILLIIREGGVVATPDKVRDRRDLQTLQDRVKEVVDAGGEALFITERQLQVFSLLPKGNFIPDYEKVELMEMVMAGNQSYIAQFYKDITFQEFDLIITDSVRMDLKDEKDAFSEEHNVWVNTVLSPLVNHYDYTTLGDRKNIYLLTPKLNP